MQFWMKKCSIVRSLLERVTFRQKKVWKFGWKTHQADKRWKYVPFDYSLDLSAFPLGCPVWSAWDPCSRLGDLDLYLLGSVHPRPSRLTCSSHGGGDRRSCLTDSVKLLHLPRLKTKQRKRPPFNNATFKIAFWAWLIWPSRVKGQTFYWPWALKDQINQAQNAILKVALLNGGLCRLKL